MARKELIRLLSSAKLSLCVTRSNTILELMRTIDSATHLVEDASISCQDYWERLLWNAERWILISEWVSKNLRTILIFLTGGTRELVA